MEVPIKNKQITVPVDDDQYDTLRRAAELDHRAIAAYIRIAALARAAKDLGDAK